MASLNRIRYWLYGTGIANGGTGVMWLNFLIPITTGAVASSPFTCELLMTNLFISTGGLTYLVHCYEYY